jgi:hypothetical protein
MGCLAGLQAVEMEVLAKEFAEGEPAPRPRPPSVVFTSVRARDNARANTGRLLKNKLKEAKAHIANSEYYIKVAPPLPPPPRARARAH